MQIHGAVIKEQGVTFAIVVVKNHVIHNLQSANKALLSFASVFPGIPVILMSQELRGTPTFFGRRDIVSFLSRIPINAIPWKMYTIA